MISYFWNWITQSVSAALNWLNQLYSGEIMLPFRYLLIGVFAFGIVFSYIILPLIVPKRGSDKVKKKKEESEGE